MRCCLFVCGLAGLMLAGCGEGSAPRAGRGTPERGRTTARLAIPHGSSGIDGGAAAETFDHSGGTVRLDAITLTAPEGWTRKQPQSSFVLAEFALPRPQGAGADGRLTISQAGGSIEANIERWTGQFAGAPQNSHREQMEVGSFKVTLVDLSGEFNDQPGPFAPPVKRAGYRMIAAIIPVNGQLHFVKAVGPDKTIEAHGDAIKGFVRSVKPID